MGACVCCYSEGAQVGQVLDAFKPCRTREAQDGTLQKVVGRVVLAGTQPFYAPVTGKPCVYYKTTVREERIETRYYRDKRGYQQVRRYNVWYTIAVASQFANFYLQDGTHKIYVPGDRGTCRIQSTKGGGSSGVFMQPPPGVQSMIYQYFAAQGQAFWGWGASPGFRTGRYDFREESFDVNEIVAALGVPTSAKDPFTNEPCKIIQPFEQDTLTEEWMKEQEWTLLQRKSWETLLKQGGAVLLSDNVDQVAGVPVEIINDLPAFMTSAATTANQFDGLYGNATRDVVATPATQQTQPGQQMQQMQQVNGVPATTTVTATATATATVTPVAVIGGGVTMTAGVS